MCSAQLSAPFSHIGRADGRYRVAAPSMAQPAHPAPASSLHELGCNTLLQVLASSSQPCRVASRLLQLSQLCAGGTDTLRRNLQHRRRDARQQLVTARQSPILPVVPAADSHHLVCRCRRSRLQPRWVAEEQSRLLDRLFHACTVGLGHLLVSGTQVPAEGHLWPSAGISKLDGTHFAPRSGCTRNRYRLPRLRVWAVPRQRRLVLCPSPS